MRKRLTRFGVNSSFWEDTSCNSWMLDSLEHWIIIQQYVRDIHEKSLTPSFQIWNLQTCPPNLQLYLYTCQIHLHFLTTGICPLISPDATTPSNVTTPVTPPPQGSTISHNSKSNQPKQHSASLNYDCKLLRQHKDTPPSKAATNYVLEWMLQTQA